MLVLIFLCFDLMGIALFSGRFWNCIACPRLSDGTYERSLCFPVSNATQYCSEAACVNGTPPASGLDLFWLTTTTNYDNIFWASLSNLRIAFVAEWALLMYDALSTQNQQNLYASSASCPNASYSFSLV